MDCRQECFCDIQRNDEGLPPLHLMLMERVDEVCNLLSRGMFRAGPILLRTIHPVQEPL